MRAAKRLFPAAYRDVLAVAGFRRLLAGEAVSYLGDGLSVVAISWLAIQLAPPEQAALVVGAAVAAFSLPAALGALVLARWLRRVDARTLVTANALLRGGALGTAALLYVLGALTPAGYVALLAVSSLLVAWGSAGTYTLVSRLVPSEHRLGANTLLGTSQTTAIILGPPLAGILVAATGPAAAVAADALTYLVLAAVLRGVRAPAAAAEPGAEPSGSGFRLLARRPELLGLLALTAVFCLLYGPVEVALPLFVVDTLGRSADFLGAYWAVFGVGAVIGGLLAGTLRRIAPWPFTIAVIAGWGAALLPFGFTTSTWVTMAGLAVGGLVYGPFPAFNITLFQSAAGPADLPAVLAARGSIMTAAVPVGAALGGPLVTWLGPDGTLLASGAATVALAALAALGPLLALTRRRPLLE